jgi:hypothetical protein
VYRILKGNWNEPNRKEPTEETKHNALLDKSAGVHNRMLMHYGRLASDSDRVRTVRNFQV